MERVLTIAGSDPCGGAGIQADLKTFFARGVYGMSVVTAVTAQNTVSVDGVFPLPADFVKLQINSVMSDIGADIWKTGMLATGKIINTVSERARYYNTRYLIVDPIMVSKTGSALLEESARKSLIENLLPITFLATPNHYEAEILAGIHIKTLTDVKESARVIHQFGPRYVLIKGGHLTSEQEAVDILFDGNKFQEFRSPWIKTKNTHGTGCTLASAISAELAKGKHIIEAISLAKSYTTKAIQKGTRWKIGHGNGPLNHDV